MITVFPYETLGQADYGWLKARYHFSFANYHNPKRMSFGTIRVINDDIVKAGAGFDPHPHRDMEIITYVRSGAITHKDSLGHEGRTSAGDVQVMSAGKGIAHAEYNREPVDTTLYQIWIQSKERGIDPRWDATTFPKNPVNDALPLLVSGRDEDKEQKPLYIHADAAIYGGRISKGASVTQNLKKQGYLLVSEGSVVVDGKTLKKGDGAEITDTKKVTIQSPDAESEILLIDAA